MVLTVLRGAIGFLTRIPVGTDEAAWDGLRTAPAALVAVAYAVGAVVAVPFLLPVPALVVGFAYPALLVLVTGITHVDGLADLGDAAVVHGSRAERRRVMRDTTIGVGGVVAVALDVLGLSLVAIALAGIPVRMAVGLAVAAEVGGKAAVLVLASLGTTTHDGMASAVSAGRSDLLIGVTLTLPAAALTWPSVAALVGLLAAFVGTLVLLAWARRTLGGVSGDVYGAGNEIARLAILYVGVITWTLS